MELSELRRWHWIVIGALLGLIIGYALNAVGTDALETNKAAKISQLAFEQELTNSQDNFPPLMGTDGKTHPRISNLVVYPDGEKVNLLRMERLINLEPEKGNSSKKWKPELWFYDAARPYSPLIGAPRTDVWVKPDIAPPDGYRPSDDWRYADGQDKGYRDPGTDGARLGLDIGKGNYTIDVWLDDPKEAADLTAKFNDHALAPFTADPAVPNAVETTVPLEDFGTDNARMLWLGRKDSPVHIKRMHIFNPTYTVREYLNGLIAERGPDGLPANPNVSYRYAWYMEPKAVLWLSVGGCVLVIGIIWPSVIGVLVGAGLGPPPREKKGVSLRNLKATPVAVPMAKVPTDEDLASLEELEDKLLKSLESDTEEETDATPTTAGPAPVRTLNAKSAEPLAPPAPVREEKPKTFKGEFYPVARKAGDEPPKKPE